MNAFSFGRCCFGHSKLILSSKGAERFLAGDDWIDMTKREINFCAEWDVVPQKSWSGTTWGLYESLSKITEIHSVELPPASGALRYEYAIRRRIGLRDFDMKKTRFQQKEYDRKRVCNSNLFSSSRMCLL